MATAINPKHGARVYLLPAGRICVKQTVKRGSNQNDDYVIDSQKERHVDLNDDGAIAKAIRDALAGQLP